MSKTLTIEPLYCSQGGIPYNKAHLDAKDAEIERLTKIAQTACNETFEKQTEINRFRADNERLRATLQTITDLCKTNPADPFLADNMDRIARAALEPKP